MKKSKYYKGHLTIYGLINICKKEKYILLLDCYGYVYGLNCLLYKSALRVKNIKTNYPLKFIGYKPISFNEYISTKLPIIVI